ncbi:MAG: hypothetical protein P1V51_23365 [Deltaproteobacteria bacterium]|nr:hypothetical protein [Deltaproteobacteria bacterium]
MRGIGVGSGRIGWLLFLGVVVGLVLPARALEKRLDLAASGALPSVEVAGTGAAAVVGWPKVGAGPGGMGRTEKWLTARPRLDWSCGNASRAAAIVVSTKAGPSKRAQRIDLRDRKLHGGQTEVELYLWSHEAVRAACTGDRESGPVESEVVVLELFCEDPAVKVPPQEKRLTLQVTCLPSADPATHFDRTLWWGTIDARTPSVEPYELSAGKRSEVSVTYRKLVRTLYPRPVKLELVRVDAKGGKPRALKTCFEGAEPPDDDPEPCVTKLPLTLKSGGEARFATRATWPDGTSALSEAVTLRAPTAEELANRMTPAERTAVFERTRAAIDAHDCGEALVEALKAVEGVSDAGMSSTGDVWWQFRDGMPVMVHCHHE